MLSDTSFNMSLNATERAESTSKSTLRSPRSKLWMYRLHEILMFIKDDLSFDRRVNQVGNFCKRKTEVTWDLTWDLTKNDKEWFWIAWVLSRRSFTCFSKALLERILVGKLKFCQLCRSCLNFCSNLKRVLHLCVREYILMNV
jgi:hypothetical protein